MAGVTGRPPKYDWAWWFSHKRIVLRQGRDFALEISALSLQKQIQAEARRREIEVRTQTKRMVPPGEVDPVDFVLITRELPARARYEWDVWFAQTGTIHLVRGTHFETRTATMRVAALQAAKRRGLQLRTKVQGGNLYLLVVRPTIETQPATEMASETKE